MRCQRAHQLLLGPRKASKIPSGSPACAPNPLGFQLPLPTALSQPCARHAQEVTAVGHRVVHGLEISEPRQLAPDVVDTIKRAAVLAPLHNGAALQGIQAAQEVFPGTPQASGQRCRGAEGGRELTPDKPLSRVSHTLLHSTAAVHTVAAA